MNLQVFPNWCKKLGIVTFVIFFILSGFDNHAITDFIKGYNLISSIEYNDYDKIYFGESTILLFSTLSLVGMLIYMLSKESVEDDFINKLRLESYQLAFFIITSITLILNIFGVSLDISVDTVIFLLLSSYLIIFAIKKRTV